MQKPVTFSTVTATSHHSPQTFGTSLDCFLVVLIKVGSVLWMG